MATGNDSELTKFTQFVVGQLAQPQHMSPEEALDLWRMQNPTDEQFEEDVAAVQVALDELAAGAKCIPLEEVEREVRARYGLPNPS